MKPHEQEVSDGMSFNDDLNDEKLLENFDFDYALGDHEANPNIDEIDEDAMTAPGQGSGTFQDITRTSSPTRDVNTDSDGHDIDRAEVASSVGSYAQPRQLGGDETVKEESLGSFSRRYQILKVQVQTLRETIEDASGDVEQQFRHRLSNESLHERLRLLAEKVSEEDRAIEEISQR